MVSSASWRRRAGSGCGEANRRSPAAGWSLSRASDSAASSRNEAKLRASA
jgi:hypothetical protein